MFGYITANIPELKIREYARYRSFYCGLCESLRKRFGRAGQLTLSYDLTFLVVLLSSLYSLPEKRVRKRCLVHPLQKKEMILTPASVYAADMGVFLAYEHLLDDWTDEKKISSALAAFFLKKKVRKVEQKYPRRTSLIRKELNALHELEKAKDPSLDLSSGCFGRIMSVLFAYRNDPFRTHLEQFGYALGRFIYLMDAWDDLEKDQKTHNYNVFAFMKPQHREETAFSVLQQTMAEASAAFEYFPMENDVPILRNILYSGVWKRWMALQNEKKEKEHGKESV